MGPSTAQIAEHSVISSLTLQDRYAEFWDSQPDSLLGFWRVWGPVMTSIWEKKRQNQDSAKEGGGWE